MAIRLNKGIVLQEVDGQAVLVGTGRNAAYWRINGTALLMLKRLLDGNTAAEVVESIARTHDIDRLRVKADIDQLIAALVQARLVHSDSLD
ncbi:PqqD family protein [Microbispora sp. NEAU-D428]|uniref:PqqD family peptide modification chaperone n=1 Tax=Microbispora sitophila TaxID=2771537 RepID=UPI001868D648|nr:PqqD family peptide modification chaperone [Microbispora sitophila]MBE3015300.1 PqqD family protein [Microbispora sitophila]